MGKTDKLDCIPGIRSMLIGVYENRLKLSKVAAINRIIDDLVDDRINEQDLVSAKVDRFIDDMPDDPEAYRNFRAEDMP